MKTLIALFTLIAAVCFSPLGGATEPSAYVTQILEPLGGKIVRPGDWFYTESHVGPSYTWTLSREDTRNGQLYTTGVRIQTMVGIKNGTGKTAKEFVLDFAANKRQSADKVVSTCAESSQGLFSRICLETEEGSNRILYSMFWGSNNMDLAVISIAGTRKELWETYSPVFQKMSAFELIDMQRFDQQSTSNAQPGPLDAVSVYLIPLDDFPEHLASSLARQLQQDLKLRVKASLRLPPLSLTTLPGTNQYAAEDILSLGSAASAAFPEASATSYRLFLTTRDINSRSANFRFQLSSHNKALNCSVVSLARLLEYANDRPMLTERASARLTKMTMRAIGEMRLGWTRSGDRSDLMYSPLMGMDDLDRMGMQHKSGPGGSQALAPDAYRILGTTLLQPEFILAQRVHPDGFAAYVTRLNNALSEKLKAFSPATPAGGFIVIAVRPGGKSKVWLDIQPPVPAALENKLIATAQSVAPFRAKVGTVVFGIKVSLWGGAASASPPYPGEWLAIASKHTQPLEAGQLADLAWRKKQ